MAKQEIVWFQFPSILMFELDGLTTRSGQVFDVNVNWFQMPKSCKNLVLQ
jgi:hypothetical protein